MSVSGMEPGVWNNHLNALRSENSGSTVTVYLQIQIKCPFPEAINLSRDFSMSIQLF